MGKKHCFLNIALFFWLVALVSWVLGAKSVAKCFGFLTMFMFPLIILIQVNLMFKKNKSIEVSQPVINEAEPIIDKEPIAVDKQATTVIASGVQFDGNIVACGHVYIHGSLIGNIDAKDNLIKVMRGGMVEGNITCRELIIDGCVTGQCISDVVEIFENGQVKGSLAYRSLAVKKGGEFSGQSEVLSSEKEKNTVTRLIKKDDSSEGLKQSGLVARCAKS